MNKFYFLIVFISFFSSLPQAVFSDTGEDLFSRHCSACHGEKGVGGKGPALRKEGLLITADLAYFENTIRYGRPFSGCPSFENKLDELKRKEIASYIKGWQKGKMIDVPTHSVAPLDNKKGRDLFPICGGCHGLKGEGAMGPPLLDPGLLKSISDTVLRRTIMYGRPGTPMKGFLKGQKGLAFLSEEEVDDIIAYIRFRQAEIEK